jgi:hypothetical protein
MITAVCLVISALILALLGSRVALRVTMPFKNWVPVWFLLFLPSILLMPLLRVFILLR